MYSSEKLHERAKQKDEFALTATESGMMEFVQDYFGGISATEAIVVIQDSEAKTFNTNV